MIPEPSPDNTVRVNTDSIPPWVAEELAACLYKNIRNYFSVPENVAKFEVWKAERDKREQMKNGEVVE